MVSLKVVNAIQRAPLFVFTCIALGITARLRAHHYNTSRVNLGLAASVIGLVLSVFVPLPMLFVDGIYNVLIIWILDFISFALYVSASGSMTQQRHICHEPARGNCGLYRAGIAFEYMCWIPLLFILLFEIYQFFTEEKGYSSTNWRSSHYSYDNRRAGLNTKTPAEAPRTEDEPVSPIEA